MSNTVNAFYASRFKLFKTRSVLLLCYFAAIIVFLGGPLRAIVVAVSQQGDNPLSSDELSAEFNNLISGGSTFGAFFLMLAMSIWVARDYSSGAYQFSTVIAGHPSREVSSRALTGSYLATILGIVSTVFSQAVGTVTLLMTTDASYIWTWEQAWNPLKATFILICAALLGLGIGYLTRSAALSVFIALTLFVVLPMALMTGSLMGYSWMDAINNLSPAAVMENTLNETSWKSALNAVGALAWSLIALVLGLLNAKRV